jgi:hypothetical protein
VRAVKEPLRRVQGSPAFWFASSVIFTVNALLSAAEDRWLLAILQVLTALLAGAAAVAEASRSASR